MGEMAELLRAVAALLWPAFAFAVLWKLSPELKDLLGRLRRGKVLGQEIELAESLNRLDQKALEIAAEVAALPPAPPSATGAFEQSGESDLIGRVLELAAHSPKAALLMLASEMERELRQLLASLGLLRGRRHVPFPQAIAELDEWGAYRDI